MGTQAASNHEELFFNTAMAAMYFWTSAKTICGREFCFILNEAIRRDDPSDIAYAVVVARGVQGASAKPAAQPTSQSGIQKYLTNVSPTISDCKSFVSVLWRGAGFHDDYQEFYQVGKQFRVPSF